MIEFKIAKSFEEPDRKADEAMEQIESRKYAQELHDDGYGTVIHYGIAFFGKDCLINMRE